MAMTLQDILASRRALYDPQRQLVQQQIAQLAPQQQADEQALNAQLDQKYNDITNDAVSRGVIYGGVPLYEKQKQLSTFYAPEAARLKSTYAGNRSKLEATLLGLNQDEMTSAQQLQTEQQKAETDAAYKQQQLAIAQQRINNRSAKPKAPSQREVQQGFNQDLMSAYQQINSGAIKYHPFIREQVAQQLAAEYGIPLDQVQKQVNTLFTDSWDNGKRGVKG